MFLTELDNTLTFPNPNLANTDGLLAFGGDLSPERLLIAYKSGIFPWFSANEPILWWSPNPRLVLYPEKLKVSKSMEQVLRKKLFTITFNQNFKAVITQCGVQPRKDQDGTWITKEMIDAYCKLHKLGHAHSVEVWEGDKLVGGLYGVALGACFFGESMFSLVSNASKAGFITLVKHLAKQGCQLIDCQVPTEHLKSLGAEEIPRKRFLDELELGVSEADLKIDY